MSEGAAEGEGPPPRGHQVVAKGDGGATEGLPRAATGPWVWNTCCKSVANVRQRCGKRVATVWQDGRRCGQEEAYIMD
eukprot:15203760-Alexandrium_andersonii.AAC.1